MQNNIFKCCYCGFELKDIVAICNHLHTDHKNKDDDDEDNREDQSLTNLLNLYNCNCQIQFENLIDLSLHLHTSHIREEVNNENIDQNVTEKLRVYKCNNCEFYSKNVLTVRYHFIQTHKNKKKNTTQNLTPKMESIKLYQQKKLVYKCRKCSIYFSCKIECLNHIQKVHPHIIIVPTTNERQKKTMYRCKKCSTCFKTMIECAKHINMNHGYQTIIQTKNEDIANNSSDDSDNDFNLKSSVIKTVPRQEEPMEGY